MKHLLANNARLVALVVVVLTIVCFSFGSTIDTRSEIKMKKNELAQLNEEYAALLEENEEYRHLLNEADIREQYEYQARELGFGYSDEIKVIDITPGN